MSLRGRDYRALWLSEVSVAHADCLNKGIIYWYFIARYASPALIASVYSKYANIIQAYNYSTRTRTSALENDCN